MSSSLEPRPTESPLRAVAASDMAGRQKRLRAARSTFLASLSAHYLPYTALNRYTLMYRYVVRLMKGGRRKSVPERGGAPGPLVVEESDMGGAEDGLADLARVVFRASLARSNERHSACLFYKRAMYQ